MSPAVTRPKWKSPVTKKALVEFLGLFGIVSNRAGWTVRLSAMNRILIPCLKTRQRKEIPMLPKWNFINLSFTLQHCSSSHYLLNNIFFLQKNDEKDRVLCWITKQRFEWKLNCTQSFVNLATFLVRIIGNVDNALESSAHFLFHHNFIIRYTPIHDHQ